MQSLIKQVTKTFRKVTSALTLVNWTLSRYWLVSKKFSRKFIEIYDLGIFFVAQDKRKVEDEEAIGRLLASKKFFFDRKCYITVV